MLTIASIETVRAGTFTIAADPAIQTLSEALGHLSCDGLKVCAPILVSIFRQPDELKDA